jgi:hypothetical protein
MPKKIARDETQLSRPSTKLLFDSLYKHMVGGVAAAVLFAWFEEAFNESPPGTHTLRAPISRWRLDGNMTVSEFAHALHHFGYRYWSLLEYNAARAAHREFLHPLDSRPLCYILVPDRRTKTDILMRNAILIDAKLTEIKGQKPTIPTQSCDLPNEAARSNVRRLLKSLDIK